ncbi:MAG TPA: 3-methyl-2-oxobutanoate hydroxymethyltransferase [Oligoflexia bacterium]|nr:3-methyl-2-oxobutanoate hydroxymethyltransferase [Oligoflexia bacterium]HMR25156.1 3-methyl-2-oxobutanoate hydroxymethyltransferase [Oligoflexia bacterium]
MNKPMRISDIQNKKKQGEKISMLTAYDYPIAKILDESGVDMLLVGDSLGNVVLGYPDTLSVSMQDMVHHCSAVSRATKHALLVCDMPFGSYQVSQEKAVANAIKLMAKGRAHAVKLEGGEELVDTIKKIVAAGIPVMGHIGLRPQSVHQQSGYKKQGKTDTAKQQLMKDAKALEKAGVFSIVLECVEETLAQVISKELSIPTIGIGSGKACDGQVLVTYDMLGLNTGYVPNFVKVTGNLQQVMQQGVEQYKQWINES